MAECPSVEEFDISKIESILTNSRNPQASLEQCFNAFLEEYGRLHAKANALQELNDDLERIINHDPDTGLPIRRRFEATLRGLLTKGSKKLVCVGVIRLDEAYSRIRHHRDRSKALLFKTTMRIKNVIGERLFQSDRLDEFLFYIDECTSRDEVREKLHSIIQEVSASHEPPADDIQFSCLLGCSFFPLDADSVSQVLELADIALAEAEETGLRICAYAPAVGEKYRRRSQLEDRLRTSILEGFENFRLVYQPFVDPNGELVGAEVLIRWSNSELGSISPEIFIPIIEELGMINTLGQWIMYQSLKQLQVWRKKYSSDFYLSVNLAPPQFKQHDLVAKISGVLRALKLPGEAVRFEITEGSLMEDPSAAIEKMKSIKELGAKLSIDDFGTGYSSLSYLLQFPVDTLKIDKAFIDDIDVKEGKKSIVTAIIDMARAMNVETLAEGVETKQQLDFLLDQGCNKIQGFFYSRPVSAEEFESFFTKSFSE